LDLFCPLDLFVLWDLSVPLHLTYLSHPMLLFVPWDLLLLFVPLDLFDLSVLSVRFQ
jgi:hypothetical protein